MKEEQRLRTIRDMLFTLAATLLCAIAVGYFYDCYYDLNDDVLIKDILAGTYTGTPEGRNIQMLYPVGFLISVLYRLSPTLPWYGIFLCTCHALCFWLIGKRVISFTNGFLKKSILLLFQTFLFAGLLLWELVYVQYSVTCAMLVATGVFLFCTTDDEQRTGRFIRKNIVSMVLVILGFYVRTEMMLLLCPLIGAAGIAKWSHGAKHTHTPMLGVENLLKYLTTPIVVAVGMGIGLLLNALAYSGDEWNEFDRFFAYRTELYDFQSEPPDYAQNRAYYRQLGLDEAEIKLLLNYNFAIDESLNADALESIVEYNRTELGRSYFKNSLYEGIREYLYRLLHAEDGVWAYLVIALYLLIFLTGMLQWDYSVPWKLALLAFMRTVSWMYLIMRGRTPERITVSLYLCEVLILCAVLLCQMHAFYADYRRKLFQTKTDGEISQEDAPRQKKRAPYLPLYRKYWRVTVTLIMTALVLVPAMRGITEVEQEQERRERINEEWDGLRAYFAEHEENFYLLDVYSTVAYSERMVPADNSYRNYELCGGWASKSPIYAEKLSRYGVGNIESDLLYMNNLYFVTRTDRDTDWMVAYYRCKGYDVRVAREDLVETGGDRNFYICKVYFDYETGRSDSSCMQRVHLRAYEN
ncbi:MAG: hypothetical protein K2N41_05125 [Lachnospiraceae bacterium]|nr:hypothetical protein [Lachnospiraceae bacterium]MDE7239076.1 hypothetical protein [Lachnospiraceae bacterium]